MHVGPTPSVSTRCASDKGCLPISLDEYLALLDWTGRQLVRGRHGAIPHHLAPIVERIGLPPSGWLELVSKFGRLFCRVAGAPRSLTGERPRQGPTTRFRPGRSELLGTA